MYLAQTFYYQNEDETAAALSLQDSKSSNDRVLCRSNMERRRCGQTNTVVNAPKRQGSNGNLDRSENEPIGCMHCNAHSRLVFEEVDDRLNKSNTTGVAFWLFVMNQQEDKKLTLRAVKVEEELRIMF